MPGTGGGGITSTSASWIGGERFEQLGLDAGSGFAGLPRACLNGVQPRKTAPAFGALVKVAPEKPTKFTAPATPGVSSARSTARRSHRIGPRQRSARRQLRRDDEIAAVKLRDESGRRLAEFDKPEADAPA